MLQEDRVFEPTEAFRAQANANDPNIYEEADRDPEGFWATFVGELEWSRPRDKVLEWARTGRRSTTCRRSD